MNIFRKIMMIVCALSALNGIQAAEAPPLVLVQAPGQVGMVPSPQRNEAPSIMVPATPEQTRSVLSIETQLGGRFPLLTPSPREGEETPTAATGDGFPDPELPLAPSASKDKKPADQGEHPAIVPPATVPTPKDTHNHAHGHEGHVHGPQCKHAHNSHVIMPSADTHAHAAHTCHAGCNHEHDNQTTTVGSFFSDLNKSPLKIAGTGVGLGAVALAAFTAHTWNVYQNIPSQKNGPQKSFKAYLREQLTQPMDWSKAATWVKAGVGFGVGGGLVYAGIRYLNPVA